MTALVLEWQRADAVRVGWVPQPAGPALPAAIVGPPGTSGPAGGGSPDPATYAANPVVPSAGSVSVGARTLGDRVFVATASALWPEEHMQGRLDRTGRSSWRAGGGGLLIAAEGANALVTVGTATTRAMAATSFVTRAKRIGYVSAATAGSLAGAYLALAHYTIGDGAGLGGFYFTCRFVPSDAATVSGARMFAGLINSVSAPTNVEPSALTNAIGVAGLSGASTLHIMFGGSTAQPPVDLGSDFPANGLSTDLYELILFAPPGTQNVHWQVTRNPGGPSNVFTATGTLINTTPGTTLPAATSFMSPRIWRCNNATALAVGVDVLWMVVETVN